VEQALSELEDAALVERVWDDQARDYAYRVLAMTRRFAYRELQKRPGLESEMRERLSNWYAGRDVPEAQRRVVVAMRRGEQDPGAALIEAAIAFRAEGKLSESERFFRQAIERNPRSWRARREYAELLRDMERVGEALEQYEKAAANAPKKGKDRALVFREYGMVLRKSGLADAVDQAMRALEIALSETPHDPYTLHSLSSCYVQRGHYRKALPLLEELCGANSAETRARSYELLEQTYMSIGEALKLVDLRDRRKQDIEAQQVSKQSKRTVQTSSRPLGRRRKPLG
jgi:tetratricopeptide (TPR) repeat protein